MAVPRAFSQPSLTFDGVPDDSQLVCLLGDRDSGPVKAVEEAGVLTVSPYLLPMKFVMPWMIFVMVVGTCITCFIGKQAPVPLAFLVAFLLFGWLVVLPAFFGILRVLNSALAKKGDYFKVDTARRTLELCRAGRSVKGSEIIAVVFLIRWYRYPFVTGSGPWQMTFRTSVLVRAADNRVELYPVIRENGTPLFKWGDRLANIFQVPVRRIELSRSESRELNDC
jgi:hypothetical protein